MSTTYHGTVIQIKMDTDIPYAQQDGTYKGSKLVYEAINGETRTKAFTTKTLEINSHVREQLEALNTGDKFAMATSKNTKGFVEVHSLTKVDSFSDIPAGPQPASGKTSFTRKGFVDNTIGMIKGNTVTNAVTLATAKYGKGVTFEHLVESALAVLKLHGVLESLDIKTLMSKAEVKTNTTVIEADTNAEDII